MPRDFVEHSFNSICSSCKFVVSAQLFSNECHRWRDRYDGHMTGDQDRPLQALILAGGLSRRLDGVPKAGLIMEGQTLLARTLDAVVGLLAGRNAARQLTSAPTPAQTAPIPAQTDGVGTAQGGIAVVGPVEKIAGWLETAEHASQAMTVQEDPPYSGPAAGIAAGIEALAADRGHVLVLACDMPWAGAVARLLLDASGDCSPGQGVMAVADGKKQPLAAIYPLRELRAAADTARAAHRLENAAVFALVANVNMKELVVSAELTADIDTWADARAQGIAAGAAGAEG